MEPLDLTVRAPRSPQITLGELLVMARTVDKARALLPGGNPGRYFISPGLSIWLLGKLGLTEEQFIEIVSQALDDEAVAAHFSLPDERRERINKFVATFTLKDISEELQRIVKEAHPWSWPEDMPIIQVLEEDDRRSFGS